jgi:hypothetical protein
MGPGGRSGDSGLTAAPHTRAPADAIYEAAPQSSLQALAHP